MAEQIDPLILVLTGQLPFVLMTSAVLALPASWLLLRWYRKALVRTMSMRVSSAVDDEAAAAPVSHGNVPCKLKLEYIAAAQKPPASELNLLLLTQRLTRQAAAVYGTAGLLFALVLALAYLTAGGIDFVATQLVVMWFLYLWPVVLVINIIMTASRARRLSENRLKFHSRI